MIIVYLVRVKGPDADVSYNFAWMGLWAVAEVTLGITVACTFFLPKFFKAKGAQLRGFFSSLTRPFLPNKVLGIQAQRCRNKSATHRAGLVNAAGPEHSDMNLPLRSCAEGGVDYSSAPIVPDKSYFPGHVSDC